MSRVFGDLSQARIDLRLDLDQDGGLLVVEPPGFGGPVGGSFGFELGQFRKAAANLNESRAAIGRLRLFSDLFYARDFLAHANL